MIKNWYETGISPVYVVREINKNSYIIMTYLVDFWCLGVKTTVLEFGITKSDLMRIYSKGEELTTISYEEARSLILGAIDFAKAIDIAPHVSWKGLPSSFIEAHLKYDKKFTFGKEGVPYYFSGPYDYKLYNVEEIVSKVSKANGHYTVHMP